MNQDERLDRLEEAVFFLEKNLRDLSDACTEQQEELAALNRRMDGMERRLDDIVHLLAENMTQRGGGEPELPPHYL